MLGQPCAICVSLCVQSHRECLKTRTARLRLSLKSTRPRAHTQSHAQGMPEDDAYSKVEAEFKVVEDKVHARTSTCMRTCFAGMRAPRVHSHTGNQCAGTYPIPWPSRNADSRLSLTVSLPPHPFLLFLQIKDEERKVLQEQIRQNKVMTADQGRRALELALCWGL
jgi:hypothetical protein